MKIRLSELEPSVVGKVVNIKGGRGFQRKLRTRGLREGKQVKIKTRQPRGPIVVEVGGTQMTIGRGMAKKVTVEV